VTAGKQADQLFGAVECGWQVEVDNSAGPVWRAANVRARREEVQIDGMPAAAGRPGNVYVPPAQEVMVYDLDGNLTRDGRWDYSWDGESSRGTEARWTADFGGCPAGVRARVERPNQNRLKGMETTVVARLAGVPWVRLGFVYDAQGRRIGKKVWRLKVREQVAAKVSRER
jgi:hypothetical protein